MMENVHIEEFVGKVFNTLEEESNAIKEIEQARENIKKEAQTHIVNHVHAIWPKIANDATLQRWVIAYLYWNIPLLTVGTIEWMFNYKGVMKIAQEVQLHGLTCTKCGKTIYVNSRSDLSGKKSWSDNTCDDCRKAQWAKSEAEYAAIHAAREKRMHELKTMPYREYLATDEWQATRIRMLKRAWFRCQLCNKQGKLNVHHRTYERRGNEDPKDLIVLCGDCHAKFHDKLPSA